MVQSLNRWFALAALLVVGSIFVSGQQPRLLIVICVTARASLKFAGCITLPALARRIAARAYSSVELYVLALSIRLAYRSHLAMYLRLYDQVCCAQVSQINSPFQVRAIATLGATAR